MALKQNSELVEVGNLTLEVLKQGSDPAVVVIPSYGRDAGEDFDGFLARCWRARAFWYHARNQGESASQPDWQTTHRTRSGE